MGSYLSFRQLKRCKFMPTMPGPAGEANYYYEVRMHSTHTDRKTDETDRHSFKPTSHKEGPASKSEGRKAKERMRMGKGMDAEVEQGEVREGRDILLCC